MEVVELVRMALSTPCAAGGGRGELALLTGKQRSSVSPNGRMLPAELKHVAVEADLSPQDGRADGSPSLEGEASLTSQWC